MRKIDKTDIPNEYLEFLGEKKPESWNDYSSAIKRILKEHMIANEQGSFCAYCEKSIAVDNSHIEHIFPKGNTNISLRNYPDAFKDYSNMLVSCGKEWKTPTGKNRTCGHAKQGQYSNDFINPTLDNPKEFFEYKE